MLGKEIQVNIENIYVCPKCDYATTTPAKPKFCKECGYSFIDNDFMGYRPPVTLTEQFEKLQDIEGLRDAVLDLPIAKAIAMLDDAQKIIETLSGRKNGTMDIRPLVERATSVGKIAEAYDAFLRAGGKHTPSLYINNSNDQENNDEPPKTDGRSSEATASTERSSGPDLGHVFENGGIDRPQGA